METFKLVLQIVGVALGLWYLWLEYRANIWLWLVGLVMPMVNGVLYAMSGLYADMGMNIYYIIAGLYGWIVWSNQRPEKKVSIGHTPRSYILPLLGATLAIWGLIWWVLVSFTDSTVPVLDSLTTALSIVATWMLAQKYVEQWLVWLVVDAITVGQRKGLGIAAKEPLYVLRLNARENEVVLAPQKDVLERELFAQNCNFITIDGLTEPVRVHAKMRSTQTPAPAVVFPEKNNRIRIVFDDFQKPASAGQSVVFYDNDTVIGGGILEKENTIQPDII